MGRRKSADLLFEVATPLGFRVRVTRSWWRILTTVKHPVMAGGEKAVKSALQEPDEIRRSKMDSSVYLFYKTLRKGRWVSAVAKRLEGEGFLVTAYPTDTMKIGERVWPK